MTDLGGPFSGAPNAITDDTIPKFFDKNQGRYIDTPDTFTGLTLRKYWDSTPLYRDSYGVSQEFRMGPFTFFLPPDAISVDQYFGFSGSGQTIRQANNAKFNTGNLNKLVTLSFIFLEGSTPLDLEGQEICGILDLILLFRGMPFCPVENSLLNDTYGIDALALAELSVETVPGNPNAFRVVLQAHAFNWHVYMNGTDFASLIKFDDMVEYLERGRAAYLARGAEAATDPRRPFAAGEHPSTPELDFRFMTDVPVGMFFDQDAISAGTGMSLVIKYLNEEQGQNFSDPTIEPYDYSKGWTDGGMWEYLKAMGLLDPKAFYVGTDGASVGLLEDMIKKVIEYSSADPTEIASLANIFKRNNLTLTDDEAMRLAAIYLIQIAFDKLESLKTDVSSQLTPIHVPEPGELGYRWYNEDELQLTGINLTDAAVGVSMSMSMSNILVSLPLQMAEGGAFQYMGGGDTMLRISMVLLGETDLAKLNAAFRLNQAIVRATKAKVVTGFIGIDSPLTALCGTRTFLPVSFKSSTIPGYPHAYSASIDLVDFDVFQQEREKWNRQYNVDGFIGNWVGSPSLRLSDQGHKINLYPDLYLKQYDTGYWEQPDFYFLATPEVAPTEVVARQNVAFNNVAQEPDTTLDYHFVNGGVIVTVNGEDFLLNYSDILAKRKNPVEGGAAIEDAVHKNEDLDFGKNIGKMWEDNRSSNLQGYMRKAFPTFFFAMIDEPRQILYYRTYTDFYARRGVSSITVNRSVDPMEEMAIIVISDVYRRASYDPDALKFGERQGLGWFLSTLYNDEVQLFRKIGYGAPVESVELKPGMRVHLRMGYSNNLNDMKIIFNGTVAEIAPSSGGGELTIIAQGDGRELLGVINASDKGGDTDQVSGLLFSEPRELIVRLLSMRGSIWRDAFALMTAGAWSPDPKNGIRHFGELLPNVKEASTDAKTTAASAKTAADQQAADDALLELLGPVGTDMSTVGITGVKPASTPGAQSEMNYDGITASEVEIAFENKGVANALGKAYLGLAQGWDQNIFSRNIYPATDSGLLEGLNDPVGESGWLGKVINFMAGGPSGASGGTTGSQIGVRNEGTITGAGGGTLWDRLKYTLSDSLDFTNTNDEPSFRAMTYMRTTWDIIQQCADLMPNYIVAVRPFNHRSTLYYGKSFWTYTSGVVPKEGGAKSPQKMDNIEEVLGRIGIYQIKMILDQYKNDVDKIFVTVPSSQGGAYYAGGTGPTVPGDYLNNIMSQYGGKLGTDNGGYGNVIASLSAQYGVPWEVVMTMISQETSYMGSKDMIMYTHNNVGGLKYTGSDYQARLGAVKGDAASSGGNWAKFPTMEAGIEAMVYLLAQGHDGKYRTAIDKMAPLLNNDSIAISIYPPPEELRAANYELLETAGYAPTDGGNNNPTTRALEQANYEAKLHNDAIAAGIVMTPGKAAQPKVVQDKMAGAGSAGGLGASNIPDATTAAGYQELNTTTYPKLTDMVRSVLVGGASVETNPVARGVLDNIFIEQSMAKGNPLNTHEDAPLFDTEWAGYGGVTDSDSSPTKLLRATDSWEAWEKAQSFNNTASASDKAKIADIQITATEDWMSHFNEFMQNGAGVFAFADYLKINGRYDVNTLEKEPNKLWSEIPGFKDFHIEGQLANFATIAWLEAGRRGLKVSIDKDSNTPKLVVVGTDGIERAPGDDFWKQLFSPASASNPGGGFWNDDKYRQMANGAVNTAGQAVASLVETPMTYIKKFLGLFGKLGSFVEGVVSMGVGMLKQSYNLLETSQYMDTLTKTMAASLYDSTYTWSVWMPGDDKWHGTTDNPFTREFGEEVYEVREPFAKLHQFDSFHHIINDAISVSDAEMYPVVTSVSKGSKARTVYADKSIAPEFQKELVYENNLHFSAVNFRDGIHAKRIGLAACARSLRTMYQGSISILGDCRVEPWDYIYIADTYTDLWGMCQVREVTHTMDAQMGYVTSISVQPIIAVDDPAQWAVSSVLTTFLKNMIGGQVGTGSSTMPELNQSYYGRQEYDQLVLWNSQNPDKQRASWYDVSVGAGLVLSYMAVGIGVVVGALGMISGQGGLLGGAIAGLGISVLTNPEKLAAICQYFDEQQDVWISLLIKRGEPYQAGLTGATGTIVGRQKSVGLDVLDFFASDRPLLTIDELLQRHGASAPTLQSWELDMQYFRNQALIDMITQDFFTSTWNLPAGGKWQTTGVMFKDMTTGVVHTINTDNTDVNYVVDGDTIWVNALDANGQTVLTKVRFAGIDAPELHTVDGSENLAGVASKLYLENLIKEHSPNGIVAIMVYPDPTLQIDYFNRLIGWIVCEDGTELNAAMLDAGMAQVYASTLRNAVDSTVEW